MNEQQCEQRSLLAAAERELSVVVTDLEWTEDMEVHLLVTDGTTLAATDGLGGRSPTDYRRVSGADRGVSVG